MKLLSPLLISITLLVSACHKNSADTPAQPQTPPRQQSAPTPAPKADSIFTTNECYQYANGSSGLADIKWCVNHEANKYSQKVIYYFHGIMGSEKDWYGSDLQKLLAQEFAQRSLEYPTIISISFGKMWFLTDVGSFSTRSRREVFQKNLVPAIESQLNLHPTVTLTLGHSMGGYNALGAFADSSRDLSAIVALCPAILSVNPYSTDAELDQFLLRHQGCVDPSLYKNSWLKPWGRYEYPDLNSFNRNTPTTLLQQNKLAANQLIAANGCDNWGFNEGAAHYWESLKIASPQSQYILDENTKHCAFSPPRLNEIANYIITHLN